MAERRMFSKKITMSDAFLEMPDSAQNLYFHLSMDADDDGFVGNPKGIMRLVRAKDDDMKLLVAKSFVLPFQSGVVVIKHWRINNLIRSDRYKPTTYTEERAQLTIKDNGAYTEKNEVDTVGIPSDTRWYPQDRIGKARLGKDSENAPAPAHTRKEGFLAFTPPTLDEVKTFVEARGLDKVDAERFFNWFSASDWYRGRTRVVNWQAEACNWQRRGIEEAKTGGAPGEQNRGRGGGSKIETENTSKNFAEREYTHEQCDSVFTDIADIKGVEL